MKPEIVRRDAEEHRLSRGVTKKERARNGTVKGYPSNRDRNLDPNRSEEDVVAEVKAQIAKGTGSSRQSPVPIEKVVDAGSDGPVVNLGLGDALTNAATSAGLDALKIRAATLLACGQSYTLVAKDTGYSPDTIRKWARHDLVFMAFRDRIVMQFMDSAVRSEAIGHLLQQLRNDREKELSSKDIFDWVKLALTIGQSPAGPRGRPRIDSEPDGPDPSPVHQHVHFHGSQAANPQQFTNDSSALLNLHQAVAAQGLTGDQKRRFAQILRERPNTASESPAPVSGRRTQLLPPA